MPGGRPRNDWKASRERKLVRLYILSQLNFDEIQNVLRADGFCPSTSDLQKRLRSLLPMDYARGYRRYRPFSLENAKQRLFNINYCIRHRNPEHRDTKLYRQRVLKNRVGRSLNSLAPDTPRASTWGVCIDSTSTTSMSKKYVSLPCLDMSIGQSHLWLPQENPDRQVLRPSFEPSDDIVSRPTSWTAENINHHHTPTGNRIGCPDGLSTYVDVIRSTSPKNHILGAGNSSEAHSIDSLQKRFANRFSQFTMEHVAAILGSSGTSSKRSSLLSLFSFSSSPVSGRSSSNPNLSISEKNDFKNMSKGKTFTTVKMSIRSRKVSLKLTKGEQEIWDDLVDESQLDQPSREIPSYPELSLLDRPCCAMEALSPCKKCGFSGVHKWAIDVARASTMQVYLPTSVSATFVHEKDNFGNSILHFFAANAFGPTSTAWRTIRWLVCKGADIEATNTSGETFLHVMTSDRLKDTREYLDLLQLLAKHKFPFSQSDHHGRTPDTLFFANINPKGIEREKWTDIFVHLKAGIPDSKKFFRLCEELEIERNCNQDAHPEWEKPRGSLLGRVQKSEIPFKGLKPPKLTDSNLVAKEKFLAKEVDANGDSALIHIVKKWPQIGDERQLASMISNLLKSGADIHMRDRNGDTALAIAALRGLRPVVTILLHYGANPNTRNYKGIGILAQAKKHLRPAKYGKQAVLYARILSCVALLTDHGIKKEPDTYDEYLLHCFGRGVAFGNPNRVFGSNELGKDFGMILKPSSSGAN